MDGKTAQKYKWKGFTIREGTTRPRLEFKWKGGDLEAALKRLTKFVYTTKYFHGVGSWHTNYWKPIQEAYLIKRDGQKFNIDLDSVIVTCDWCKGTGFYTGRYGQDEYINGPCPRCNGKGKWK